MEIIETKTNESFEPENSSNGSNGKNGMDGRVLAGIILAAFGGLFLLRELGVMLPEIIFTWPMILIGVGLYTGARHNFSKPGWLIIVLVGAVFLIGKSFPDIHFQRYLWPIILIGAGLFMIFKPKRNRKNCDQKNWNRRHFGSHHKPEFGYSEQSSNEDYLEVVAIFGGTKRVVLSKNFKGGEINAIFGGSEVNLMQSDIDGRVVLEVNNIFGGTKLLVPANWDVQSDIVTILGGVEDKRPLQAPGAQHNKVLVLKGACVFGGVDIKSY
jgi:predicted membrane protein